MPVREGLNNHAVVRKCKSDHDSAVALPDQPTSKRPISLNSLLNSLKCQELCYECKELSLKIAEVFADPSLILNFRG